MIFRGFRVKPSDRGLSYFTAADDNTYEGKTDSFNFVVIAKDEPEAHRFAKQALGEIPYVLQLSIEGTSLDTQTIPPGIDAELHDELLERAIIAIFSDGFTVAVALEDPDCEHGQVFFNLIDNGIHFDGILYHEDGVEYYIENQGSMVELEHIISESELVFVIAIAENWYQRKGKEEIDAMKADELLEAAPLRTIIDH